MKDSQSESRDVRVSIRIDSETTKKLEFISKNENKKLAGVCFDSCKLYAELYPSIQLVKALQMNPDLNINEDTIKKKIYDAIKNTL